jgi:hypothetical protein
VKVDRGVCWRDGDVIFTVSYWDSPDPNTLLVTAATPTDDPKYAESHVVATVDTRDWLTMEKLGDAIPDWLRDHLEGFSYETDEALTMKQLGYVIDQIAEWARRLEEYSKMGPIA